MKARLMGGVLFVLALALTLSLSARPGGKAQPGSPAPQADRDHDDARDRDDSRDRDKDDACRNDELFEHSKKAPLEILGVIPVPGKPVSQFDINGADPVTERVYTSDRANAAVDIIDAEHNLFVGRVPGFTGLLAAGGGSTTSAQSMATPARAATSFSNTQGWIQTTTRWRRPRNGSPGGHIAPRPPACRRAKQFSAGA